MSKLMKLYKLEVCNLGIKDVKKKIDELSNELDCGFLHGDRSKPDLLREINPEENEQIKIAALVVSLVLIAFDKFPLLTEPVIALKRLIIITMPASMGAIIVDSFDKE